MMIGDYKDDGHSST